VRTFGVTQAIGYASNILASGILDSAWKHNEWSVNGGGGDGIFMFHNVSQYDSRFPFLNWIAGIGGNASGCPAALAAATKSTGDFSCNDVALRFLPNTSDYYQPTHFPFGTWGCARGYYQNIGLTNSSIQMWFTGPDGIERKIIDISNLDTTWTDSGSRGGYGAFLFNNYSNYAPLHNRQTTFRYEDNIHIREGAPVSCAQIGFGGTNPGSIDSTPPTVQIVSPVNGSVVAIRWSITVIPRGRKFPWPRRMIFYGIADALGLSEDQIITDRVA
jgi:hypothetical protein